VSEEGSTINVRRIAVRCSNPAPATTFPLYLLCVFCGRGPRHQNVSTPLGGWRGLEETDWIALPLVVIAQTSVIALRIADPNVMDPTRRLL
jgi:hypothetical protein